MVRIASYLRDYEVGICVSRVFGNEVFTRARYNEMRESGWLPSFEMAKYFLKVVKTETFKGTSKQKTCEMGMCNENNQYIIDEDTYYCLETSHPEIIKAFTLLNGGKPLHLDNGETYQEFEGKRYYYQFDEEWFNNHFKKILSVPHIKYDFEYRYNKARTEYELCERFANLMKEFK